jgi:hypothetical protein
VDVEHARQHPLARRIDDAGASGVVELVRDRDHVTAADADVADCRGAACAVEPAAVADDRVVAHQVIEQRGSAGVNEIREQISKNVYYAL